MAVLGVTDHRILGMPDGALADHDEQGLAAVGALLDEVEPDTILTFGPDGITFHPDHIAVSRWVTEAWRRRGCRGRLLYAAFTVGALRPVRRAVRDVGHLHDRRAPRRASSPMTWPSMRGSTVGSSIARSPPSRR